MITVVAIRHAKPVSGEGYSEDFLRPLSEEGVAAHRKLTRKLRMEGITPTFILSSPFVRAVQTGEIMGEEFHTHVIEEPALGDPFDKGMIMKRLRSFEEGSTIFLIGHAPTLAELVEEWVGEPVLSEGLGKSEAAVVEFAEQVDFGKGKFQQHIR